MSHNCLNDFPDLVSTSDAESEPDSDDIPPLVSPSDSESEPDSDDMPPLVSPSDSESERESPALVRGSASTDEEPAVVPAISPLPQAASNHMLCHLAVLIGLRADERARVKIIEITDREVVVSIRMQKRNTLEPKHIVLEAQPSDDTLARFIQLLKEHEEGLGL
ncbi:hypothetical protein B0H11DRAFT_1919674 [Mycena galericulata]|nr:hypothetical protein B0H11DRAFT_1919674 [Mycena galericulata]